MSVKSIRVKELYIQKNTLDSIEAEVVEALKEMTGYDLVASGGKYFIDAAYFALPTNKNGIALSNDMDVDGYTMKEATIDFTGLDLPDEPKDIPEFGVTLDGNMNIIQVNISKEDIEKDPMFSMAVLGNGITYWDTDAVFHANGKSFTKEKFEEMLRALKVLGFADPVVVYVDKNVVRPYYFDIVPFVYVLAGYNRFPVRAITYVDIAYLNGISQVLYEAVKKVPANLYYHPADEKDCSAFMVDNFSDKRDIIKQYDSGVNVPEDGVLKLDIEKFVEILPYFFEGEMEPQNKVFLDSVMSHSYPSMRFMEDGHFPDAMSLSESLYRYICGFIPVSKEQKDIESLAAKGRKTVLEQDFEPELYPFDTFDYAGRADDSVAAWKDDAKKRFGIMCAFEEFPTMLPSMDQIDRVFDGRKLKVKILGKA